MRILVAFLMATTAALAQAPKPGTKLPLSAADRSRIEAATEALGTSLAQLKGKTFGPEVKPTDALADASVAHKAATWIVRHGEFYREGSVQDTLKVLEIGARRASELAQGKHPWTGAKGGSARGFVSKVDGSVQPYAVYVPESYDGATATRLDVILHGRDATLTEVKFLLAHEGKPYPKDEAGLLLHVYGRGNNAYRWAGETDVLEAIEATKRNYRVDENRIVLRGFSMGGAGAWHLGLRRPSDWCAVEAGAGFTETVAYAKLKDISDDQAKLLRIYDAVDYAANARMVPIAGYGGEDDPQLAASRNIVEALKGQGVEMKTDGLVTTAEGLDFRQVIGAKMGHAVDPASAKILKEFRDDRAKTGQLEHRSPIRFVTYTLKANKADWITIEGMTEHYKKALVDAELKDDLATIRAENVSILGVERDVAENVKLGDQTFLLRSAVKGLLPVVYLLRVEEGWELLEYEQSIAVLQNASRRKRPGLQGPIDDAFVGSFLCVRGTGKPWNDVVDAAANRRLETFAAEWNEFLRGDLPIKDDRDVTAEDIEMRHLVLFGDPGSNLLIARVLSDLPIAWTKSEIKLDDAYPSKDHLPALIAANPLNRLRYVVLNSGHTFGARDFLGTNALLYPRLGDWAILRTDAQGMAPVASGFLNERWRAR